MFVKMALEIWKWRLSWPLCIFSMSVGNDFQLPRKNQGVRHFQCPECPAPTGDRLRWTSAAGPGRRGASRNRVWTQDGAASMGQRGGFISRLLILLNESGGLSRFLIDRFVHERLLLASSSQRRGRRLVWIELHLEDSKQCCRRGIIAHQRDKIDQPRRPYLMASRPRSNRHVARRAYRRSAHRLARPRHYRSRDLAPGRHRLTRAGPRKSAGCAKVKPSPGVPVSRGLSARMSPRKLFNAPGSRSTASRRVGSGLQRY